MTTEKSGYASHEYAIIAMHDIYTNLNADYIDLHANLNGVKMTVNYHHGDLRRALLDSALQVLAEKGLEQFSLRETARRAGVSPAAYKHHFASTRVLMTELAAIAFTRLADRLEAADKLVSDPRERFIAQGTSYVRFALDERQLFALMWRSALLDTNDPQLARQKDRAFNCLDQLLRGADAEPTSNTDESMAPTIASWSLVHGFACLALDGAFGHDLTIDNTVERMMPKMLSLLDLRNLD